MKDFLRKNGRLILLAAILLTAIAAVGTALFSKTADPLSDFIGIVTTPVRNGVNAVMNWAGGIQGYLTEYDELKARVAELEEENAQLREAARTGQDASEENERLRTMLGLREKRRDLTFESARVTAFSSSNWESSFTISKGSNFDITAGDCVITENGVLVGVVSQVGYNWATVASVIDTSIEIGGVIARTDSAGVIEGDFTLMTEGKVMLDYLPQSTELIAGDEVLTSGMGGVYPAGLVVGHVTDIRMDDSGLTRYAEVAPEAELAELIQVFVITDFDIIE